MTETADAFVEFAVSQGVLRFGEFTLKSGRVSPYFFDAGLFNQGSALAELGRFYARAIDRASVGFDMLFGPAYKGIPLVSAAAIALADAFGRDVPYAFNRKEAKSHGEGGAVIGAPLAGKVLIVDDVITAGTAVREAVQITRSAGARPVGIVVALDRQESGPAGGSATQEARQHLGLEVISIARLDDLQAYAAGRAELADTLKAIEAYRRVYGA